MVALGKHTIARQLEDLTVVFLPFRRTSANSELSSLLTAFEAGGGLVIESNPSLDWDTHSGTADAHDAFLQDLKTIAHLTPFRVDVPDNNPSVYPFFYTE